MDCAQPPPAANRTEVREVLSPDTVGTILWESAWSALTRAFLFEALGSVAVSLLGEVFREMTPSHPPIGLKPEAETGSPSAFHGLRSFVGAHHFWIIYAVLFVLLPATRLAGHLENPRHRDLAAALLRVGRRLSGHWFRLFVLNAFAAWVWSAVVLALQRFSWTQLLWNWSAPTVHQLVNAVGNYVPGGGALGRWYAWYGQNQAKFLFWLLYSGAICDDLGWPNYKTLIRWGRRRLTAYLRMRGGTRETGCSHPSARGESVD